MSSDKPLSDLEEGARRAELNWTKEQIGQLIKDIKDGKIGIFNEISSAVQSVRIQRSSSEWKVYSPYIKDQRLRKLANWGLQVRLASGNKNKIDFLHGKVSKKYGLDGWHVSEFVANKVLSKFILSVMDVRKSPEQLTSEVEQILNNIERDVSFIHADTIIKEESEKVIAKLTQLSPNLHILTSKGGVRATCKTIEENIRNVIKNYSVDEFPEGDEYVVFFKKIPDTRPMFP